MSVMNVQATHRQCPRCGKVQPLPAAVCDGCGRRFQVPDPGEVPVSSSVYAAVPRSRNDAEDGRSDGGRGISAWWGPAAAALFVTPLGWVLLPLALLLCVVTAALGLTVLPTLLGVIAAVRLRASPLPFRAKACAIPLTLALALGLNALLWHVAHQIAFTLSPPP